jgi:hypothetical protein
MHTSGYRLIVNGSLARSPADLNKFRAWEASDSNWARKGLRSGKDQDSTAALAQKASVTSAPASRTGTMERGSPRL